MRPKVLLVVGFLHTACAEDPQTEDHVEQVLFSSEPDRFSTLVGLLDADGTPLHPVHANLMPNGSVVLIGKNGNAGLLTTAQRASTPASLRLTRATPAVEIAPFTVFDQVTVSDMLFCAGHTQLADGSLFTIGGTRLYDDATGDDYILGMDYGTTFNGSTWTLTSSRMVVPGPISVGRWYGQATRLADKRVLITGGWDMPFFTPVGGATQAGTHNISAEIYDPATGAFTAVTALEATPAALFNHDYTHAFVLPTGDDEGVAFGESSAPVMWKLSRPGVWTTRMVPRPGNLLRADGTSIMTPNDGTSSTLLPLRRTNRQWGYANGAVLFAGGAHSTPNEYSIDVYDPVANRWCAKPTATTCSASRIDMEVRRHHPSTLVLPDGRVLVVAGHDDSMASGDRIRRAVFVDPARGFLVTEGAAVMGEVRGYHTVSLLLPDGRVLIGGGRSGGPSGLEDERTDLRYYSPPYLTASRLATRPTITTAPTILRHGTGTLGTLTVTGQVSEAVLIGLGSMTHSFDSNQRYVQLGATVTSTGVTLSGPLDARMAPAGYYMLFVLDAARTPSVAKIVRVCAAQC